MTRDSDVTTAIRTGQTLRRRIRDAMPLYGGDASRQELLHLLVEADDALFDLTRTLDDVSTELVLVRDAMQVAEDTIREHERREANLREAARVYDQRTGAPIDPQTGYPWEGMGR